MADRPHTLTGAKISVYYNGRLFGVCTGVTATPVMPVKPARGIDSQFVQEYMPTTVEVTGTVSIVRIAGDGGLQGQGILPLPDAVSRQRYGTLLLVDRLTDLPVFRVDYIMAENESWQFLAKDIVHGSFNYRGIVWGNETS